MVYSSIPIGPLSFVAMSTHAAPTPVSMGRSGGGPTPRFGASHRWSFKNNAICGICLGQWVTLLWRFGAHVEWTHYWQRVAFVTALACFNSLLALVEQLLYGRAIAKQAIHPRPLFILGHPRTGTTLLHSLLALDGENFGTCSTFCAGFPSSFLWFERFKSLLSGMIDAKRPMDNMELSFDSVQVGPPVAPHLPTDRRGGLWSLDGPGRRHWCER